MGNASKTSHKVFVENNPLLSSSYLLVYRGMEKKPTVGNRANLSFSQAEKIRRLYRYEEITQIQLSKKFKVSQSTISQILRNKTYLGGVA